MQVHNETHGDTTVIRLVGDLDSRTSSETLEQVLPLLDVRPTAILDLSGVPYMSSAGLRTMLLLHRQALCRSISMTLVGLSDELRSLLSATGLLRFFTEAPAEAGTSGGAG